MATRLRMRAVGDGVEYFTDPSRRVRVSNKLLEQLDENLFWQEHDHSTRGFSSEQLHQLSTMIQRLRPGLYNAVGIDVTEEPNGRYSDQQIFLTDNRSRGVDDYPVWIYFELEKLKKEN